MASEYIQQLSAVASVGSTYVVPMSDDPSGVGRLKKASISQIVSYLGNNAFSSFGIGITPATALHVVSTTEQIRAGYDVSNYLSVTTAATGSTTFALTGTSPTFTFSQAANFSSTINKVTITPPATSATLTIANTGSLITSGAYAITLTATNTTNVTLPTSGTLATVTQVDAGNTVADSSSATCWVALYEAATGVLLPKTDGALTYNASTGELVCPQIRAGGLELAAVQTIAFNTYYSSGFKYRTTNYANYIDTTLGNFYFNTAPSGTAGNAATFTNRLFIENSTGNVGVNTVLPLYKTHIHNAAKDTPSLMVSTTNSAIVPGTYVEQQLCLDGVNDYYHGSIRLVSTGTTGGYLNPRLAFCVQNTSTYLQNSDLTERMTILGDGKVGVGCTPTQMLDVNGTIINSSANAAICLSTLNWQIYKLTNSLRLYANGSDHLVCDGSGNVTVGHGGTALGKLEARTTSGAQFVASYDGSNYVSHTVGSSGAYTVTSTGASGSMTFTPTSGLTFNVALSGGAGVMAVKAAVSDGLNVYDNSSLGADKGGGLYLGGIYTGSTLTTWAAIRGAKDNATDGQYGGYLSFLTRATGFAHAEAMRITSDRNVGIGLTSSISARVHAISTTEQLRLGYDASNYLSTTVSSVGLATFTATGTTPQVYFTNKVGIGSYTSGSVALLVYQNGSVGTAGNGACIVRQDGSDSILILQGSSGGVKVDVSSTGLTKIGVSETPVISSAMLQVYNAGSTYGIFRNTTDNIELLVGADTATGIVGTMTNQNLQIRTNNTAGITLDTTQNVGIGLTSSISARVHAISTTEQLRLGYDVSNYVSVTVGSAGNTLINAVGASSSFQFSDNVGINRTPTSTLDVYKASTGTIATFAALQTGITNGAYVTFSGGVAAATVRGYIGFGQTGGGSASLFTGEIADSFSIRGEGALHLGGSGNNLTMTLVSGNVGIGTTSPLTGCRQTNIGTTVIATHYGQLALLDDSAIAATSGGMMYFGGKYTGSTYTTWAGIAGLKQNATDSEFGGELAFYTRTNGANLSTGESMRINASHNIGIGLASSISARLHVISTTEQLRLGYDVSNYVSATVGSTGAFALSSVGTGGTMTFTPTAGQVLYLASTKVRENNYCATLTLTLPAFANAVANQKVDLYMTGTQQLWGMLDVYLTDTYSNQAAAGCIHKRFYLGLSTANTIYVNESRIVDEGGLTADNWAISDLSWDVTNTRYKIMIVHRVSTGNSPSVVMKFTQSADSTYITNFMTFTNGAVYTTDTTVYARPYSTFNNNLYVGVLAPTTVTPTSATSNITFAGGSVSPVLGAATADMVSIAGVDKAAGDRRLYIRSESGSDISLGNDRLNFTAATAYMSIAGTDILTFSGTSTAYKISGTGAVSLGMSYTSYTADGLFGGTALPSRFVTGGGGEIRLGYTDDGVGSYAARLGFYSGAAQGSCVAQKSSIGAEIDGTFTIKVGASNTTALTFAATGAATFAGGVTVTGAATITSGSITGITDITVADGGTGRSSHTAYAVICGGTTTTAAQQSVASVGTSGQVLTSNGAGTLPTFQNAAASGPSLGLVVAQAAGLFIS